MHDEVQRTRVDTREKIVSLEEVRTLAESGEWAAVVGLFDPLTLTQAERIRAIANVAPARKILAVVVREPDTLLTEEARAALVAGLRDVDAVTISTADAVRECDIAVYEDAAAERERTAEFVNFIRRRQQDSEAVPEPHGR